MESMNLIRYPTIDLLPSGIGAITLLLLTISIVLLSPNEIADILVNVSLLSSH